MVINVFGTEKRGTRMRDVSSEKIQVTHMPKSAITMSNHGSLVRKIMFSGLFTSHALDRKISPKIGRRNDKGEGQHS